MKNQKCNFCKSINTLKINKINPKNVKMSKMSINFSRMYVCVYTRVCTRMCAHTHGEMFFRLTFLTF